MGVKQEVFIDNSAPTCGADHLNGTKDEINNAILAFGLPLDDNDPTQLGQGILGAEVSVQIIALNIDWSLGKIFRKNTTGSPTLTFSHATDRGKTIRVVITDTDSGTVTWPSYIVWDNGGSAPTQTVLKTDIYEFEYTNGNVYGKRIYVNCAGDWPYGVLGDLHVTVGNTPYQLTAGQIYDYDNITIDDACVLEFIGDTVDWTVLGIKGNLAGPGSGMGYIRCKSSTAVGTGTRVTPDGVSLSATITQSNGGVGGNGGQSYDRNTNPAGSANGGGGGGNSYSGGYGGTGDIAGGGGGGGYSNGGNASGTTGGTAGTGPSYNQGGSGANAYGQNGTDGTSGTPTYYAAGGGGGGSQGLKGAHGKNLYIRCKGTVTGTYLTIDVSGIVGGTGGNGGNGGTGKGGQQAGGGGSGAGGSGGSGGNIVFHYWTGHYTAPNIYLHGWGGRFTRNTRHRIPIRNIGNCRFCGNYRD